MTQVANKVGAEVKPGEGIEGMKYIVWKRSNRVTGQTQLSQ